MLIIVSIYFAILGRVFSGPFYIFSILKIILIFFLFYDITVNCHQQFQLVYLHISGFRRSNLPISGFHQSTYINQVSNGLLTYIMFPLVYFTYIWFPTVYIYQVSIGLLTFIRFPSVYLNYLVSIIRFLLVCLHISGLYNWSVYLHLSCFHWSAYIYQVSIGLFSCIS